MSIRKDVMICGANASGKTRWLTKYAENAKVIWPKKQTLYLRAVEPLLAWYSDPRLQAFAEKQGAVWAKMPSHERVKVMIDWVNENKAVLIIDDAHALTARKLDIVRQLVQVADVVVTGAFAEGRIPITLRVLLQARNPQKIDLKTTAAYDSTNLVVWLVMIAAISIGWWQLAAAVGSIKILARGNRATKQT